METEARVIGSHSLEAVPRDLLAAVCRRPPFILFVLRFVLRSDLASQFLLASAHDVLLL